MKSRPKAPRPCNASVIGGPAPAMDPDARGPGVAYQLRNLNGRELWAFVQERLRERLMEQPLAIGTGVRIVKHSVRWIIEEVPALDPEMPMIAERAETRSSAAAEA